MNSKALRVLGVAAVLFLTAVFAASATPVGQQAPITKELASYFTSFGVDPQYLGKPLAQIPADQATKINNVLTMADDTVNLVFYHQQLVTLINGALNAAVTADYAPVYIEIGNYVWSLETGDNPTNVPAQVPSTATAAAASWVPLG